MRLWRIKEYDRETYDQAVKRIYAQQTELGRWKEVYLFLPRMVDVQDYYYFNQTSRKEVRWLEPVMMRTETTTYNCRNYGPNPWAEGDPTLRILYTEYRALSQNEIRDRKSSKN